MIPARMASTRLPGKPLLEIDGETMIRHTYEQCAEVFPPDQIYVATDSVEIKDECKHHNMQVVMTSSDCLTGTDRIAEFAETIEADYYINVQGDEPIINPDDIDAIAASIETNQGTILNGYARIEDEDEYRSIHVPKVTVRPDRTLLYMSRAPIPGNKTKTFQKAWKQICIYAFPQKALKEFASVSSKTPLEQEEDIEILRFLELGYDVQMVEVQGGSIAVDTPEDLEAVRQIIASPDTPRSRKK